jgi:NhaP-type Na+/H+ or K+/H+ antiporter
MTHSVKSCNQATKQTVAALLLSENVPGADIAVSMVALAVLVTLLLQATTARPLARRLGLAEEEAGDQLPVSDR